jgi:hypothetical protein
MGGSNTQTSTSSTASSDPQVQKTLDPLLQGISTAYNKGPQVYNHSLYAGVGPTSSGAWTSALNAANNPNYAAGINGAIANQSGVAAGNNLGQNDPGYAALRAKLQNDVTTGTNSSFNNSGLFGSDNNQTSLARGLTEGLGGLDYQQYQNGLSRQQQAIQNLPGLYQAAQAPSATAGAVGASQDANSQAELLAQNDLFQRNAQAPTDLLAKLSAILQGGAQTAGTTTTASQPSTPWWQSVLGAAVKLA